MKTSPKIYLQPTVAKRYTYYIFDPFDLKIKLFTNYLTPSVQLTILILYPGFFNFFISPLWI